MDNVIYNRVSKYAYDVINEVVLAGKYVKLACLRYINDLKRAETDEFEYYFDLEAANKVMDYAELLVLAEGDEVTQLELADFQCFIIGNLFGWRHKETGYRRFVDSYVQVGRQNGKSLLNGILGTYCANFDGYNYAQVYCTATKMDQAKIVLREMIKFINSDEELGELFKIQEYKSTILALETNSVIRALGKDTKSIDGFRPYLGIVDEYHAHKDNQMYRLLKSGTQKLKQSLISVITTAGKNLNGPCYKMYKYCCGILDGAFKNERQFVYIAQLDEDDDIFDSSNYVKANPLYANDPTAIKNLETIRDTAKDMGGDDLADFMTKNLNIWVQYTDNQYIGAEDWTKCGSDKTLEDFRGESCNVGVDLSSGGDLTSIALEFAFSNSGQKKYFIHSHSFIPIKVVEERKKTDDAPYDDWIRKGLLTPTATNQGIKTDYKYILKYLKDLIDEYDLKVTQIGYDPHNAATFLSELEEIADCVEIYQSHRFLNDCTEDFRLEVKAGNVEYNKDNELLTWSIINAKTVSNSYGEIKIDKDRREKRIDPVDAIIDAHKLSFKEELLLDLTQATNEYLKLMGWA